LGQPSKKPHKPTHGTPVDRRQGGPTDRPQSPTTAPLTGWTRQEWAIAGVAGIVTLALVGAAIWQAGSAPGSPVKQPLQLARIPVAEPAPAPALPDTPPTPSRASADETVGAASTTLPRGPGGKLDSALVPAAAPVLQPENDETAAPVAGKSVPDASPGSTVPDRNARVASAPPAAEGEAPAKEAGPVAQAGNDARNNALVIDEADEYENTGAEDFACPVPWLRDSKMTERVKYLTAMQKFLKSGWEEKPAALETARGHFEAAKRLCADDPRLDYSFGLVLWKHGLHSEARKEWEAATRTGKQPFLPALSVLAWATLLDKDSAAGFAAIERVAEAVAHARGDYPTLAQRSHATLFLGRAIGFLKGPGKSPELIEQVLNTEQKLFDGLPDDLRKTFEHGQAQAARRCEQFQQRIERPEADVVAEREQEKQRMAEELSVLRQELKQWDERRRAIPREVKKQLAAFASESADLETKTFQSSAGMQQGQALAIGLSQPQKIFAGYRTYTEEVLVKGNDKNGKEKDRYETVTRQEPQYRNETPQEVDARLKKRDQVLQKVNHFAAELRQFNDRYAEIPQERNDLLKAIQHEKQEKGRAASAARRKIAELAAHERDLDKDFTTPDELRKRMTSLAPYVPWTPDSDREGLLASYRQSTSQPSPRKAR